MYLALATSLLLLQSSKRYSKSTIDSTNEDILEECIFNVICKSVKQGDAIVIINNDLQQYLWRKLIQNGNDNKETWSFIQYRSTTRELLELSKENLKGNVGIFLIQIKTPDELTSILEKLQYYVIFESRANFLVTSTTKFGNTTWALSSIFESLWKANIYNSLVVLPRKGHGSNADLFTWFPYGTSYCIKDFSKFKQINRCSKGLLQKNKELYPNKIPHRLTGCSVKVRTVVWPPFVMQPTKRINNTDKYVFRHGFEIVLMNTIAKSMNLNLTYTLSEKSINWGEVYENGSATGMQAFLLENEGDIGLSSQAYTQSRLKFFDMGAPYFYEHLVWCVPHANAIPAFEKVIVVFSFGSWIVNLSAIAVFVLLVWFLSKLNSEESYGNFSTCIQNAFGILLGIPIVPLPRSYSVRLPLCFWFIFTMHLNIIYKTSLISMLANPVYETQMNTVEGIIESGLRLQFIPTMKKYFDSNQNRSKKILEKWIDCIDLSDCMDRVAYTRDSVMLLPRLYLKFIESKYRTKHESFLYCFDGKILTYPGSMLMRKGFPLRDRINRLISGMVSAGLVDQWKRDALSINLTSNKTSTSGQLLERMIITSKDQAPAFVCLALGLLIATVTFVCEIALSR